MAAFAKGWRKQYATVRIARVRITESPLQTESTLPSFSTTCIFWTTSEV